MQIKTETDGTINVSGLGDIERRFPRLLIPDLTALQREAAPVVGVQHTFVTIFDLNRWAETVDGADAVLLASIRRDDSKATVDHVRAMGSVVERVQVARVVLAEALTYGGGEASDG